MMLVILVWLVSPFLWLHRQLRLRTSPRRFLLIQTAKIGDLIYATPLIKAMRARHPQGHLAVLVHPNCAPILTHCPDINELIPTPKEGYHGFKGKRWLLQMLIAHRFDCVIHLNPSLPAWTISLLAGIPLNAAIVPPNMKALLRLTAPWLTHRVTHSTDRLQLETASLLLQQLDIPVSNFGKHVTPHPAAQQTTNTFMDAPHGVTIGVAISAGNAMKAMDENMLVSLIKKLLLHEFNVVLIGATADRPKAAHIINQLNLEAEREAQKPIGKLIDTVGAIPLDHLCGFLKALNLFISVDSGTCYCAEAAGTPVIVITGPTEPKEQRPTTVKGIFLTPNNLPCAPCSFVFDTKHQCQNRTEPSACIRQISTDQIFNAVNQMVKTSHFG